MLLDPIQDTLELHPAFSFRVELRCSNTKLSRSAGRSVVKVAFCRSGERGPPGVRCRPNVGPQHRQTSDRDSAFAELGVQASTTSATTPGPEQRAFDAPAAHTREPRSAARGGLLHLLAGFLNPMRAVAHFDVEAAHAAAHRGDFFLILRRHVGHCDRPAVSRGTPSAPALPRSGHPCRARAARLPAILRTSPSTGTPAASLRSVLGEGGLVGTPPDAQRPTAASGARFSRF